jgi:hypothetical protein
MTDNWGAVEEPAAMAEDDGVFMNDVPKKLFNKWTLQDVQVSDISLQVRACAVCRVLVFRVACAGSHRRQGQVCEISAALGGALPSETIP